MKNAPFLLLTLSVVLISCQQTRKTPTAPVYDAAVDSLRYPQELHLRNVRQLTFGGDNAEAYFSFNDQYLTLQRADESAGIPCDQIFWGKIPKKPTDSFDLLPVSNGKGRTTCSYFYPGDEKIIYASTHVSADSCPPAPDMRKAGRYVWAVYPQFEIFIGNRNGQILQQLTENEAYDAEATLSPDGTQVVFTSDRDGDLDLYLMNLDGTNVRRMTHVLGYDGGAFFTPDGKSLIFRASRPKTPEEQADYKSLLAQGLVAPTNMELFMVEVDGSNLRQITHLGGANWAPFMHPSGKKIIFSSNHAATGGRYFNLYMINLDGTSLEQISFDKQFDAFPMFSHDGTRIVFSSNRNNGGTRSTNVFIADWVE